MHADSCYEEAQNHREYGADYLSENAVDGINKTANFIITPYVHYAPFIFQALFPIRYLKIKHNFFAVNFY